MTSTRPWAALTVFIVLTLALAAAATASPHLYWTENRGDDLPGRISRANLDGSGVKRNLARFANGVLPHGLAADAQHLYWTSVALRPVGIGRMNLNGSEADQAFTPVIYLPDSGYATAHTALTAAGGYLYWTNTADGSVGRAKADGTEITAHFIVGDPRSIPAGITAAGDYIYWTNEDTNTIARAKLDGSDVNLHFITGAHTPEGITVAGGYVFWGNISPRRHHGDTVGRARLDGSHVNQRFLDHEDASAMAARGRYIYGTGDDLWRARIDGTHLRRRFLKVKWVTDGLVIR
jgi:virginiamycin B lyase